MVATNLPLAGFTVSSWHTENGLPDGSITAIEQTPDGYLWVGTFRGLARFDGVRFTVFNTKSAARLPDESIEGLLVDSAGRLWIGCESGDLVCYANGTFKNFSAVQAGAAVAEGENESRAVTRTRSLQPRAGPVEDAEGGVWFQTGRTNLLRVKNGRAEIFSASNGLPSGAIYGLMADRDRQPWLLTGGSFYRWSAGKWTRAVPASGLGPVDPAFGPAQDGGLWIAAPLTNSWMAGGGHILQLQEKMLPADFKPTPVVPNVARSRVTALIEDRRGRLWLGMHWNGVFVAGNSGDWSGLNRGGAIAQSWVTKFFEDRQGALWVGTYGDGLFRVTERSVAAIPLPRPANRNLINTVCAVRDGSVWVGTDGAGVFRYAKGEFTSYGISNGLASEVVYSIFEDSRTNLWFGMQDGLFRFVGGNFLRQPEITSGVAAMFEDRENNLWFSTRTGVVKYRDGNFTATDLKNWFGLRAIAQDRAGDLWVAAVKQGLYCLRTNGVEHFDPEQGQSSTGARSLWCDAGGGVWIGTLGGGLIYFRDGKFKAITTEDGLPDDTINSILEDDHGYLWCASYNGCFGCPRQLLEKYERGKSPLLVCRWLNLADGLAFRECSGAGQPVASRAPNGRIWFANQSSLAGFFPEAETRPRAAGKVLIESVLVDGVEQVMDATNGVRVSSKAQRFEFRYTSPDLNGSANLSFRYKLEGFDRDWADGGTRREAFYDHIRPGQYKFFAMVGSPDGSWHASAQGVNLEVVPQLWERTSVQVITIFSFILLLVGTVWQVARARLKRRLERLEMQQATERERTRIAQDLHDDLGTSLTEISLLSAVARSPSAAAHEVQDNLETIADKTLGMVKALDEIVWSANPKNDTVRNLINYLCFFAQEFLQPTAIRCRLDVPSGLPDTPLDAEQRHTLFLVVKEALANAAKHSAASELWLRATIAEKLLAIAVEDNGKGLVPAAADSSRSGLSNMQARMARLGGRCELGNLPGHGTVVRFELPLK